MVDARRYIFSPIGPGTNDQDRPAGGERDLLRTRPARLRLGAIGIELAEDGQMLVQHYPPVLATPDSQKLEKRPLPNSSDQPARARS